MGSIILYAIVALWLAIMALAVTAPFYTKSGAAEASKAASIPLRQTARETLPESLEDRTAA